MARRPSIRCGIIGYGKVGHTRQQVVLDDPRWTLVAVADPAISRIEVPKGVKALEAYEDLLALDLDAVFVCTPNHVTADAVVAALERGLHVFCEKPPGRDLSDVSRIVEAERRSPGSKLKFGFNHRYHDSVLEAKRMIEAGELGRLLWVRGIYGKSGGDGFVDNWRSRKATAGGGVLLDQGIHMLDLFRLFLGDLPEVKSFVGTMLWPIDVEDNAFAILRNSERQVAMFHSSSTQWKHRFVLELFLTEGYVTIQGFNTSTRSYGRESLIVARNYFTGAQYPHGVPTEEVTYFDRDDSWKREVDEFIECILADRPIEMGTSQDAYRAMELVFDIYGADASWAELSSSHREMTPSPRPRFTPTYAPTSRRVIVLDDIREEQIRPHVLLDEYLAIVRSETKRLLGDAPRTPVPCPGCGGEQATSQFEKEGFQYADCPTCGTLFVTPRPSARAIETYVRESAATRFWSDRFFRQTREIRKERIVRPRLRWLSDLARNAGFASPRLLDVGSGYGILLEEACASGAWTSVIAADPIRDVPAACAATGVPIIELPLGAGGDVADIVTAFEVVERSHDPDSLFSRVASVLPKGGIFALTTMTLDGFDLQVLWEHAQTVYPPDRLNLLTLDGIQALARRHRFEVIELSTPGRLDVDIVLDAVRRDPSIDVPRFVQTLARRRDPAAGQALQDFLQAHRLSSHLRLALRKC